MWHLLDLNYNLQLCHEMPLNLTNCTFKTLISTTQYIQSGMKHKLLTMIPKNNNTQITLDHTTDSSLNTVSLWLLNVSSHFQFCGLTVPHVSPLNRNTFVVFSYHTLWTEWVFYQLGDDYYWLNQYVALLFPVLVLWNVSINQIHLTQEETDQTLWRSMKISANIFMKHYSTCNRNPKSPQLKASESS